MGYYTKAQIVEQVYLKVAGGTSSMDSDVLKADIESYLPAAANAVMMEDVRFGLVKDARKGRTKPMSTDDIIPLDIIGTFVETIQDDTVRDLKYVELSKPIVSLPGSASIFEVSSVTGQLNFVNIKWQQGDRGIELAMQDTAKFWIERYAGTKRIYLKDISDEVEQLLLRYLVSVSDIGDDETLPVPDDIEDAIVQRMVLFFVQQRELPSDNEPNNLDKK